MRDIETIDSELRLVAVLRSAARGGPLPSIDVAANPGMSAIFCHLLPDQIG